MLISKNTIYIIIAIIILLTAVTIGFIYYNNYQRNKDIAKQLLVEQNQELVKIKKRQADYEAMRQASTTKDDKKCRGLENKTKDDCFYLMANNYLEVKYCDEIIDGEVKKRCQDIFIFNNIIKTGDSQQCFTLQTDFYKNNCLEHFFSKIEDLNECERFTDKDKIRCNDVVSKKQAYAENNINGCNDINDKFMKEDCQVVIKSKPKDSDNDGLSDSEELSYSTDAFKADTDGDGLNDLDELSKYFTDPKNPDSDGDGNKDGDEVKNGFKLNGPGRLDVDNK